MGLYLAWIIPAVMLLLYAAGLFCAVEAIKTARTPQGSVAWAVSLATFPYLALPMYLIFGRRGFWGYIEAMRGAEREGRVQLKELIHAAHGHAAEIGIDRRGDVTTLERLAVLPCLAGNSIRLLIDGEATFAAIFEAIRHAKSYVLVQFFIIRDDRIGNELKDLLLLKRGQGTRVYVLFDEIGSHALPHRWVKELQGTGAEVTPFRATRGWKNRFQINFRNHRKIVVVDGREAFLGGHNVGDEYLGRDPKFGHWRDTHIALRGPAVQAVQLSFVMDWYWATRRLPELEWRPEVEPGGGKPLLLIPTGPADRDNNCEMMLMQAAHSARHRLWITSPYFVPSPAVFAALQLAALRGVDVRVILPQNPDHLIVYLAAFPCISDARQAGVRVYRYTKGFLHQKVMLIDNDVASVGTANLDNRSVLLNFELTMWCFDRGFAAQVEQMLMRDLADSREVEHDELENRSLLFAAATEVARLSDPVL